jgi:uncharacterized protein YdhG (YjbR/CyaY superfamily)
MMKPEQAAPQTIDEYIAGYPPDVQKILKKIRTTIRKAAPKAAETIKYQMPTFTLNGNLVSFGVYKRHIGIYPVPAGTKKFQQEIAIYRSAKSTVSVTAEGTTIAAMTMKWRCVSHDIETLNVRLT